MPIEARLTTDVRRDDQKPLVTPAGKQLEVAGDPIPKAISGTRRRIRRLIFAWAARHSAWDQSQRPRQRRSIENSVSPTRRPLGQSRLRVAARRAHSLGDPVGGSETRPLWLPRRNLICVLGFIPLERPVCLRRKSATSSLAFLRPKRGLEHRQPGRFPGRNVPREMRLWRVHVFRYGSHGSLQMRRSFLSTDINTGSPAPGPAGHPRHPRCICVRGMMRLGGGPLGVVGLLGMSGRGWSKGPGRGRGDQGWGVTRWR